MNTDKNKKVITSEDKIKSTNTKTTVLIIFAVVITLLLLLHCLFCSPCNISANSSLYNEQIPFVTDPSTGDTVMTGNIPNLNEEDLKAALKQKQDDSSFTVQVVSEGEIKAGSKDLYLTVANPASNKQDCRIHLLMDGENVYTSPVMPPKTYITHETISKELDRGNHRVIVKYFVVDEAGKEAGIAEVEAQITCK